MKPADLSRAQMLAILGGASIMLSLAMGMRQSWGLFQPHLIRDLGITTAEFSFAFALQNIVWGVTQPFIGAVTDRYGARPVSLIGVVLYAVGLWVSLQSTSAFGFTLGSGVLVGLAMSCVASQIALNVAARTASAEKRSLVLGSVSAIGSLGIAFVSPMAQMLLADGGWQVALIAFLALTAAMLPAAWFAGGADKLEVEPQHEQQTIGQALREAAGHRGYVVLATAFFVCGLQLTFLITHMPTYLEICGIDASVSAQMLGVIGFFNVIGSYLFGWLGGLYSKRVMLGGIYVLRSLFITLYFLIPPSPTSTLIFAAAMGTLWLGVVPLVTGLVVHIFGLRYLATLSGIAFFSHQLGSFFGAWAGGLIYGALGSYELAWKGAVAIGLIAGIFQMGMNVKPTARMERQRAALQGSS